MTRQPQDELIRLVELEYDRTAKFIDGVIATGATIRGWAVTIWLAVIGVAFDRSVWELGVLAVLVAAVFLVIDGDHAWLYGEAMARANELERLEASSYDAAGRRAGDPDAARDLRERLEAHRFGLYRNFKRFRFRDLWFVRPTVFFRVFYPFLALVGVAAAVFIALQTSDEGPQCRLVSTGHERVVQCGKIVLIGNHVTTLP